MRLFARQLDTPLGAMVAAVTDQGALVRLHILGAAGALGRAAFAQRLEARGYSLCWDGPQTQAVADQLSAYFRGERRTFDLALWPQGTAFQRSVWQQLCCIPFGTTVSYGELARRVGSPRACRAVGQASGANPVAIVVPCHRVIGADGSLTGFASGLPHKRLLLRLEARQMSEVVQIKGKMAGN
jgi:O-6-methylguanine DNA methyltransferase